VKIYEFQTSFLRQTDEHETVNKTAELEEDSYKGITCVGCL